MLMYFGKTSIFIKEIAGTADYTSTSTNQYKARLLFAKLVRTAKNINLSTTLFYLFRTFNNFV